MLNLNPTSSVQLRTFPDQELSLSQKDTLSAYYFPDTACVRDVSVCVCESEYYIHTHTKSMVEKVMCMKVQATAEGDGFEVTRAKYNLCLKKDNSIR